MLISVPWALKWSVDKPLDYWKTHGQCYARPTVTFLTIGHRRCLTDTNLYYIGIRRICQLTIMILIISSAKFVYQFIFCIVYLVVVVVCSKRDDHSLRYLTFSNSQQVWQSLNVKQVVLNLGGPILYLI